MAKFKVGDRIQYGKEAGRVTEILDDLKQIRIKLDSGPGLRVSPESLKPEGGSEHKMVEGPRG